ncbi:efflux transporter outer membrane subunit [Stenotrophomonas sp. MMGLT7]|uniref:efflux transporter outer membrane subunit n=1 Tax=Stenotrophomonas sp. MMGLT7 TaxID=2901227 RepID=UPI001E4ECEC2|nr:efflux transporter outer membrane subunit [Stenotrophomonas sp. MMGLT7]MCD7098053.1 efflux transporter outer membrane subunit [Stenotrophomonas sp. MMGLT7]
MSRRTPAAHALLAAACLAVLSGCASMAPRYARPDAPVPQDFGALPAADAAAVPVAELDWRQVFLDPQLQQVIALALDNNRDLRVAMLNIEKARASYRIQRADLLPSVDASASHSAARSSAATSSSGTSQVSRSVSAEVGISSWELDLFGRIRSLKNEALETWLATAQTQRDTRMSLVAEVAGDWLSVGAYRQRLALAQQTLGSQRETLKLTEARHAQGVVSGVDLAQVQSSVESARADVASYTTALAQARNALQLVVGAPVADALLPGSDAAGDAVALAPLPADLSSTVLLQRPDVLYAEHTLKAANADIGAARAAFFPTIALTASTGRGSDELSSLFDAGTRTWSFVPSITLPIFHAGALKASLDAARIEKDITVAQYEQAIQTAFSEVADALAARANIDEQLDAQRALVEVTQRSYTLAEARWRNGVDSYLDALDSQRSLYTAQQDLITLRLSEASNRVTLYKVLGGGADAQSGATAAADTAP